jgi:hypothetical protein
MEASSRAVALLPHPQTSNGNVRAIEVRLSRPGSVLTLNYAMIGDLTRVRIPAIPQQTVDELWRHTCFEAFVGAEGGNDYYEFNFSPSAQWAVYYFQRYRERAPIEDAPAPEIETEQTSDRLRLNAAIDLGALPCLNRDALSIGLAAVVEDDEGALSYWALRHPPGKPDFHHADGFAFKFPTRT